MKKTAALITGLLLIFSGFFIIFYGVNSSFKRVSPDEEPPSFLIDIEKNLFSQESNNEQVPNRTQNEKKAELPVKKVKVKKVMTLLIPAIQLQENVYEGTSRRVLMSGPGHISGTSYPDKPTGNCCVSGHRVTFGGPFRKLNLLKPGDEIQILYKGKKYFYEVIWIKRVKPTDNWVLKQTELPSLTLTTCDPPYSARYRLVVRAVRKKGK